jgi:Na+-translocating ferredoxin:NAD+ oxidoreductase RnfC subunit
MDDVTRKEVLERIRDAGVVGAGGGGFPAHVKYDTRVEVVLANGAECEPLARVDQQRMASEPQKVLRGLQLAMEVTGASRGVVGLKKKYVEAIQALGAAIRSMKLQSSIGLHFLDDTYPAGDEFVLVREVLGKNIPEFGLPLHVGAVVSNVSTLIDVAEAVDLSRPVTHRFVTVGGSVARPSTLRVPVGSPLSALVRASGGPTAEDVRVIVGGPMMGVLAPDPEEPVTKTTSMVLVLPADHPVVQRRLRDVHRQIHLTRSACLKCMMCTEVCPRNLLGHRLYPDRLMRNLAAGVAEDTEAFIGAYLCSECGLCAVYGCVMTLDPCAMNHELKAQLEAAGVGRPEPGGGRLRDFEPIRRVPTRRLIARLGLIDYDRPAPLASFEVKLGRVAVKLRQHAGAAAVPVVAVGQTVIAGDLLADMRNGSLGARVHTGVDGKVADITEQAVVVELE